MRSLLKGWNWLYLPKQPYARDVGQSAEWNRGAYLVQGLGHCGACHTPRGLAGAEKGGSAFLSGALIDGWYAQPLRSDSSYANDKPRPGLSSWTETDITDFLKTGRSQHTAAFGSMADVVSNSTQHMTAEDLLAIARYLKSIGTDTNPSNNRATPLVVGAAIDSGDSTTVALQAGDVSARGAMIYLDNCGACHRSNGRGASRTFPALAHSSVVAATDATSLIRIVLQGAAMPYTIQAPSALAMPRFDWRLNDENVADVLSFVRASWGNTAAPITPASVAKVRAEVTKSKR